MIRKPAALPLALPLAISLATVALVGAAASSAVATEMPTRKPGLWDIRMVDTGSGIPGMTMQQCTDASTDKDMIATASPMSKDVCSKQDIQKTAAGYVADAVCTANGMAMTSHSEITGDFDSAYIVKVTSRRDMKPGKPPREMTMTIEAKWVGPCKPNQKPGDMVMPGGFKMNIKDLQKLKAMLPKQ